MADILHVPAEPFWGRWVDLFAEGVLGIFPVPEAKIRHICRELGRIPSDQEVAAAAHLRYEYEAATMLPRPEAVEVLRSLKNRGLKLGLITDCSAEAPAEWPNTPLSALFDVAVFSCRVGLKKPDPRIYRLALKKLGVKAADSLYIGDGSSRELSGADNVGMTAVWLKVPGELHADVYRIDLENWLGRSISSLNEVSSLL